MSTMDIFNNDAFSLTSMTEGLDKAPFQPSYLGNLGIFTPEPINTTHLFLEEREGTLALIPTSNRGTPLMEAARDRRKVRAFDTSRIAKGVTLYADEIQNVRAYGTESELEVMQTKLARLYSGPTGILSEVELTFEHMRLGAIQGVVLDADGSTELWNWYDEFGIAAPTPVSFELDVATTDIRKICADLIRSMARASKGAFTPNTTVHALVGDAFWDALINHPTVRETYLNYSAAAQLRGPTVNGGGSGVFGVFEYGGITFHNYRGTDDESTIAIGDNEAKFFPVGAPGMFRHVMAPAEFFEYVNTPGRRVYGLTIPDRDRNAWVRAEAYSYPLFICTRPDLLRSATLT